MECMELHYSGIIIVIQREYLYIFTRLHYRISLLLRKGLGSQPTGNVEACLREALHVTLKYIAGSYNIMVK